MEIWRFLSTRRFTSTLLDNNTSLDGDYYEKIPYAEYIHPDQPLPAGKVFDIREYGAQPGDLLNTEPIRLACEACRDAGGGVVLIDGGCYRSGTVQLYSNTTLFIASGSEVSLCVEAAKRLVAEGRAVRVVSMPSMELFLAQKREYRDAVLPEIMKNRVIVEAGVRFGWDRFRLDFLKTRFVTMDDYGASGPYKELAKKFGFTADNALALARELL